MVTMNLWLRLASGSQTGSRNRAIRCAYSSYPAAAHARHSLLREGD